MTKKAVSIVITVAISIAGVSLFLLLTNNRSNSVSQSLTKQAVIDVNRAILQSRSKENLSEKLDHLGYIRIDPSVDESIAGTYAFRRTLSDKYFSFGDGPHSKDVIVFLTNEGGSYRIADVYIEVHGF